MEMGGEQHEEVSGGSPPRHLDGSGRYARYTMEQIEVLEKVYSECPKPTYLRRQQLGREFPVLANIEPKQIKIWFQNRRCREKQRTEATKLLSYNRKLAAMNEILMGENDRLQKQVTMLVSENGHMRETLDIGPVGNDGSCRSVITTPQPSMRDTNNPAGLLSIAEETLTMFLSKAKGTTVTWVQMPGMKPGPDSVGIFSISQRGSGVAARTCGLVNLDASKIAEILKDRSSWFQDCRSLEVFATIPTDNGGIVELVYTQTYAPTTLAQARDFWTLRYTTTLDNGSLVVCERSLSGSGAGPDANIALQFVRAEMLPSGYLISPCEGGGSIVHIVDHINLEARSVPEVLRPIYESSEVVAQRMTIPALRYARQIAHETTGDVQYAPGRQPAILRAYSQQLSRCFNEAINGFSDDGWSQLGCDATEEVIITVKSTKTCTSSSSHQSLGGILCAKASMLLKNVPPAELVRFLREHRSEWADFSVDSYCAASLKASSYRHPGMRSARFSGRQIMMPLGHTIEHEQMLEVIRLESLSMGQEDALILGDVHLLQMCNGTDETSIGSYSELVFAPIDDMLPDNGPLLPSGFRIIPLNVKSSDARDILAHKAQAPSSSHRVGQSTISNDAGKGSSSYTERAILTIAFQFPIGDNPQETVALMARQYVLSVISSVQRLSVALTPLELSLDFLSNLSPGSPDAQTLAQWIWQSYCSHVRGELLRGDWLRGDSILKNLWNHQEAIVCCSLKLQQSQFIFANQAGLNMLETTLVSLQDITVDKVLSDHALEILNSEFRRIMQHGSSYLPGGICTSTMGRDSSYDEAIAWKVLAGDGVTAHCLAISFVNSSFP